MEEKNTIMDIKNNTLFEISSLSLLQKKISTILAIIVVLFAINNTIYFTPGVFGILYFCLIAVFAIIAIAGGGKLKINIEMWFLYIICWVSILMNDIPYFFRAEFRCIAFLLLTLLLTPAITSDFLASFRVKLFQYLLNGCVIVSVLSLIGRFIGFSNNMPNTGLWCGITAHPMLLGPISGVATITLLYKLFNQKSTGIFIKMMLYFAFISCLFCLFGAASRASIIATIGGCAVIFIKTSSFSKIVPLILVGVLVFMISLPRVFEMVENIAQKNKNETSLNFDSRSDLWKQRIAEFKQKPVVGIGFGYIEDDMNVGLNQTSNGQIEPGSSLLIIFSMTGILGGIAFLMLFNNTMVRIFQCQDKKYSCLLIALGVFWGIEMCAEGFIFAAGSFLCFMFWGLIGAIEGITHFQEKTSDAK